MNYWHLQMNKGTLNGTDFTIDQIKDIVLRDKIIGTGEWEDRKSNQCKQFKEVIEIGDVVMVRNGVTPIALVEVIEKNIRPNKFYHNEHKIELLSLYDNNTKLNIGIYNGNYRTTLERVADKTKDTGKFIKNWHQLSQNTLTIEKRVARICWNDKGWVEPSGAIGKSNDKNSHESQFGYGHEEWLFDTSKIIDGYHYAFLEPVRKQHQAYKNNAYNIWLYSIDGETKKRYYIGEINNAIVIDDAEAKEVYNKYNERGWLDEMVEQIRLSQSNEEGLSGFLDVATDLFNVKFKATDVDFKGYNELPDSHVAYTVNRYSFNLFQDTYKVTAAPKAFAFIPPQSINNETASLSSKKVQREPKEIEIKNLHRVISDNLTKLLRKEYGNNKVTPEHPTCYGMQRIDIVVNDKGKLTFYEIKTYVSLQTSIREAFGQIMEYAHWINANNANELIIVTQSHSKINEAKDYIKHLRTLFNIPLYLQMFDVDENKLSEKF